MKLLALSDNEILAVAGPILADIVNGTNSLDWDLFSRHMPESERLDPKVRADVERQWQETDWLRSLHNTAGF